MMSLIPASREMRQRDAWLLAYRHLQARHMRRMEKRLPSDRPSANFDSRFERIAYLFSPGTGGLFQLDTHTLAKIPRASVLIFLPSLTFFAPLSVSTSSCRLALRCFFV